MDRDEIKWDELVIWIVASIIALALAVGGGFMIYDGIEFMGTPLWGYEDNQLAVYLVVGGGYAVIGMILLVPVCLLIRRFVRRQTRT